MREEKQSAGKSLACTAFSVGKSMDDLEHPHAKGQKNATSNSSGQDSTELHSTCCCGRCELHKGIIILSVLTVLFSILFIAFESFFRGFTPWWVWGGTLTGIGGGFFGCLGALRKTWFKLTFLYLVWAILLTLWWLIFLIVDAVHVSRDADDKTFWDMIWSIALFVWTAYTVYVINTFYNSIKPKGSKWNAFGEKPRGYDAIE